MSDQDFSSNKKGDEEDILKCEKCGKEKKKSEGMFALEGSVFCCRACCGNSEKGEHKEKKNNVCEFC
jgi:hypothetical protein